MIAYGRARDNRAARPQMGGRSAAALFVSSDTVCMRHERFPEKTKRGRTGHGQQSAAGGDESEALLVAGEAELIEAFLGQAIAELFSASVGRT